MTEKGYKDGVPDEEYHRVWPQWSSTSVRAALISPARAIASKRGEIGAKGGQIEGTLQHCLLLEPDTFEDRYVIMPPTMKRDKRHAGYCNLLAKGKIPIKPQEVTRATEIVTAIKADPLWQGIVDTGMVTERSWFCEDPTTGVPIKARTDIFLEGPENCLIIDLKPSPGDRDFSTFIINKGYHIQAAFYQLVVSTVTGKRCDFMIVSHSDILEINFDLICVAEAVTMMEQLGVQDMKAALQTIKLCEETGQWPSRNRGRVETLEPPHWALRQLDDTTLEQEPF